MLPEFDKYDLYLKSVQSPRREVEFLQATYKELRGERARVLREDFCGTFKLLCEWVKEHPEFEGIGVDLDQEPIAYGQEKYAQVLTPHQQNRLKVLHANVLSPQLPHADIITAFNFSYFVFKTREVMKEYFLNCHRTLKKNGILTLDCFGGYACFEPNEEETVHDEFSYFWDQESFDPVTHHAQFYIHFKRKGEKKRERVFAYDWRVWSIPELRDLLGDVGFTRTHVYWEGTDKNGEGDGVFKRVETCDEVCESWVAYVVAEK